MKCSACGKNYDEANAGSSNGHSVCPYCLAVDIVTFKNSIAPSQNLRPSNEPIMVKLQNPIATGFLFAFGFFLFSLILTIIGIIIWVCIMTILFKTGYTSLPK